MEQSSRACRGSGPSWVGAAGAAATHPVAQTALLTVCPARAGISASVAAAATCRRGLALQLLLARLEAGHERGQHILLLAAAAPRAAAVAHQ